MCAVLLLKFCAFRFFFLCVSASSLSSRLCARRLRNATVRRKAARRALRVLGVRSTSSVPFAHVGPLHGPLLGRVTHVCAHAGIAQSKESVVARQLIGAWGAHTGRCHHPPLRPGAKPAAQHAPAVKVSMHTHRTRTAVEHPLPHTARHASHNPHAVSHTSHAVHTGQDARRRTGFTPNHARSLECTWLASPI